MSVDMLAAALPQRRPELRDVWALFKPRLSAMVLLSCAIGAWLALTAVPLVPLVYDDSHSALWLKMARVLLAVFAVVAGSNGLNSYLERDVDARMERTKRRPLPQGRLEANQALVISLFTGSAGVVSLYQCSGPLTALLGFLAFTLYACVYTPMKQLSVWALPVGAIPGAMPPLLGWSGMTGALTPAAWALFALIWFWQMPHFLAIALYMEQDYRRGGIRVMPTVCSARATAWSIVLSSALLLPVSLLPYWAGCVSFAYVYPVLLLGLLFFASTLPGLQHNVSAQWARQVFRASLGYLTAVLWLLVCCRQSVLL